MNATLMSRTDKQVGNYIVSGFIAFNLLFWLYPSLWLGLLSVSDWRFFGKLSLSGTKNFLFVVSDTEFWTSFWNVWRFMLYYIPISLAASLAFAIGLRHVRAGRTFIALCFLLAYISSGVSYSLVFSTVFSSTGPLNRFLQDQFGVTIPWLTDPSLAMLSVSLVITWKFVGYYGLIIYSGLNTIPQEIYDAAKLDGCPPLRTLLKVTVPMINTHLVTVVVLAITVAFAIFTEPFVMTGGGPMNSTTMPQLVMYETAFQRLQPGHAAMMAIITAVVSYCAIQLFRKFAERPVELS